MSKTYTATFGDETVELPPLSEAGDHIDGTAMLDYLEGELTDQQLAAKAFRALLGSRSRVLAAKVSLNEFAKIIAAWADWSPEGQEPVGESAGSTS